jgi:hypothetical protein
MKLKKVEALSDATHYSSAGKVPFTSCSVITIDDPLNKEFFYVKAFAEQALILAEIKAHAIFHIGGKLEKKEDQEHFIARYIKTTNSKTTNVKELRINMNNQTDCLKYAGKMVPTIDLIMDMWGDDKVSKRLKEEFGEFWKIYSSPKEREKYKVLKQRLLTEGLSRLGLEVKNGEVIVRQGPDSSGNISS